MKRPSPLALLAIVSLLISILLTFCVTFDHVIPQSQYTKVLADLKQAGVNDPELIKRVHWSITGAPTATRLTLALSLVQNVVLFAVVGLLWPVWKRANDPDNAAT
jgi:hypothetical protein